MKKTLLLFLIVMISLVSVKAQLTESFDGATFPPAGWLNIHTTGANNAALWERGTAGAFGGDTQTGVFSVNPHSGSGMAIFTSYDYAVGEGAHLITGAVDLTTNAPHIISFWMYRDGTYSNPDSISVYVNTAQSGSGATFLGKILRRASLAPAEFGSDGWYQYSFNIPPAFNTATNYFIFSAVGSFGNNMFIDDITVTPEGNNPINNQCNGAITITAGNVAGNAITSTTVGATISLPGSSTCAGTDAGSPDDDVWFEFTTNASAPSGTLTITPSATGGIADIVVHVYAATSCTNLVVPVVCVDLTVDAVPEVLNLNQLAANTHYFMRIYSWANTPADRGGFSIVASAGNTLPVRLATFAARRSNGVNILNWTTEQELNTSHFIIERSSDARNFVSIGQVAATGNSNTVRNYTFTDLRPARGNNYYRLRSVDKDNASKVSDTRRIRNEGIADISIYPNPVNDKLTVVVNADKATDGQLTITDVSGKIVYTRIVKLPQGNTILPITLGNIATGSYVIKIQLKDDVIIKKFNKQ